MSNTVLASDTDGRIALLMAGEAKGSDPARCDTDGPAGQSPAVVVATSVTSLQHPASGNETTDYPPERHGAETSNVRNLERPKLVVFLPPMPRPTTQFQVLQEWEGTVVERLDSVLKVRLIDKTAPHDGCLHEQTAEIPMDEIEENDWPLVMPGAVFYWSIGYRIESGTRRRESALQFRRLPPLLEYDLRNARDAARARIRHFNW
jgi:hypothetical protein